MEQRFLPGCLWVDKTKNCRKMLEEEFKVSSRVSAGTHDLNMVYQTPIGR